MRVLFAANPDKSMFHAMVSLAAAMATAGHDVRVASQPHFAGFITQAGLTAVAVGRDQNLFRSMRHSGVTDSMQESSRNGLLSPYDSAVTEVSALDLSAMRDAYELRVLHWHRLDNFPLISGLVEFARAWRPDVVLWEPLTFAGAIAARACGAVHGRVLWSLDVFGVTRELFLGLGGGSGGDPLGEWLAGYAGKFGFDFSEDLVSGQFTVDQLPASLGMRASGLRYVPMRYCPYGGAASVPEWVWAPRTRPRVAITLGITSTECFGGYAFSLQDTLTALADVDIEVVATVAEKERRLLTHVPDNTRVVSYVPLHALAPTCAAVINHAGPGTFLTTALHGVPQLTIPYDFDEPELASRAAAQGGSVMIPAHAATGAAVREALVRLLADTGGVRRWAVDLAGQIRAMPSPNQTAAMITDLVHDLRSH